MWSRAFSGKADGHCLTDLAPERRRCTERSTATGTHNQLACTTVNSACELPRASGRVRAGSSYRGAHGRSGGTARVIGKLNGCVYLLLQEAATQRKAVVGSHRDVEGARLRP